MRIESEGREGKQARVGSDERRGRREQKRNGEIEMNARPNWASPSHHFLTLISILLFCVYFVLWAGPEPSKGSLSLGVSSFWGISSFSHHRHHILVRFIGHTAYLYCIMSMSIHKDCKCDPHKRANDVNGKSTAASS